MIFVTAVVALAGLCWLLFHLATLALPLSVGIWATIVAHQTGAGLLGSALAGFAGGVLTLAAGQLLFGAARTPLLRAPITFLFAAPAAIAGYSVVSGILGSSGSSGFWSMLLGAGGAVITGSVAIAKLSALAPGGPRGAASPAQSSPRAGVNGISEA